MANSRNKKTRQKNYNDKSIRSIDKNLENSKVFDTKKLTAKHSTDDTSLEKTNVQEFHFDDSMLTDIDSLDTSFMEGNKKKKKKEVEEELEAPVIYKTKTVKVRKNRTLIDRPLYLLIVVIISIVLGGLLTYLLFYDTFSKTKIVTKIEEKKVVDENIVFLGDSLFEQYDLDEFYPNNSVVNSGVGGNKTTDILDNMKDRVYKYNPSKVFILIGTNDLAHEREIDEIVDNTAKIVSGIKENRKLSDIYLVSILPVNDNKKEDKIDLEHTEHRSNSDIKEINKKLEKVAKEKKVTYVDAYNDLLDEDGRLDLDYTTEGLHLTDKGYEVLTDTLSKYIDKKE